MITIILMPCNVRRNDVVGSTIDYVTQEWFSWRPRYRNHLELGHVCCGCYGKQVILVAQVHSPNAEKCEVNSARRPIATKASKK